MRAKEIIPEGDTSPCRSAPASRVETREGPRHEWSKRLETNLRHDECEFLGSVPGRSAYGERLLLSGDIESNSGPPRWPCGICKEGVKRRDSHLLRRLSTLVPSAMLGIISTLLAQLLRLPLALYGSRQDGRLVHYRFGRHSQPLGTHQRHTIPTGLVEFAAKMLLNHVSNA